MNTKKSAPVAVSLLSLALAGCASYDSLTEQEVLVTSNPSGAVVVFNGKNAGPTPVEIVLKRNTPYQLQLTKDGYKTAVTELVPGPIAGDPATGFAPSVNVTLEQSTKTFADFSAKMTAISGAYKDGRLTQAQYQAERAALVREYTARPAPAAALVPASANIRSVNRDLESDWLHNPFAKPTYETEFNEPARPTPAPEAKVTAPTVTEEIVVIEPEKVAIVEVETPTVSTPPPPAKPVAPTPPVAPKAPAASNPQLDEALAELDKQKADGTITAEEYKELREEIIKQFKE